MVQKAHPAPATMSVFRVPFIAGLLLAISFTGCANPSSHVVVGQTRAPQDPRAVRIYNTAPPIYDEIALLDTSSLNSLAIGDQAQTDLVIQRLQEEAARLGANGIILQSLSSPPVVGVTSPPIIYHPSGIVPAGGVGTGAGAGVGAGGGAGVRIGGSGVATGSLISAGSGVKRGSGVAIFVPPPPSGTISLLEEQQLAQLETLKKLRDEGIISATEYDRRRKLVIAAGAASL